MFDIGWTELLLIAIVALIVVGPKDLPAMFHALGRFTAKARSMARDFSRAMEDAAKESGVGDITKDLRDATSPTSLGVDKLTKAADRFEKWDPLKDTGEGKKGKASDSGSKPSKPASEMGPETAKLAKERAAAAEKVKQSVAEARAGGASAAKPADAGTGARAKAPAANKKVATTGSKAAKPAKPAAAKPAAKAAKKASQ